MNGISLSTFKSDFTLYLPGVYKHYLKVLCPYPELQNDNNGIAVFGGDSKAPKNNNYTKNLAQPPGLGILRKSFVTLWLLSSFSSSLPS